MPPLKLRKQKGEDFCSPCCSCDNSVLSSESSHTNRVDSELVTAAAARVCHDEGGLKKKRFDVFLEEFEVSLLSLVTGIFYGSKRNVAIPRL